MSLFYDDIICMCVYEALTLFSCSGLSLAAFSGIFLAFQFLPVEFLRRCEHDAFSCNG